MAFTFTPAMSSWAIASIMQSLKSQAPEAWAPNVSVSVGKQVTSDGRIYAAITSGNTGAIPPNHTSGIGVAGGIQWLHLGRAASQTDMNSNLYLGIGRAEEWDDELNPPQPNPTSIDESKLKESLLALVRIGPDQARMGIVNRPWAPNTVVPQYDDATHVEDCYVVVDNENIYKCIDNNRGAQSTVKPSGRSSAIFRTADGYIWKYMASIPSSEWVRFATTGYVPVEQKLANDGSEQWAVQAAAQPLPVSSFRAPVVAGDPFVDPEVSIVGEGTDAEAGLEMDGGDVKAVYVTSPGTGYKSGSTWAVVKEAGANGSGAEVELIVDEGDGTITVGTITPGTGYDDATLVIVGDGTGAKGTVTVAAGVMTGVTITDSGSGYTWARAFIIPGASGAVAEAIIGPVEGHGKNIIAELGANALIFSLRVSNADAPYIFNTSFRQLCIMSAVRPAAGSPTNAPAYLGPAHPQYGSSNLSKYGLNSGTLLYLNNIEEIEHSGSQEETVKVTITF